MVERLNKQSYLASANIACGGNVAYDLLGFWRVTDRLHIGNRWMAQSGFNTYDNTARMHYPLLPSFDAPDPLSQEYPSLSPYSHCTGTPLSLIDPTGKKPSRKEAAIMAAHVYEDEKDDENNKSTIELINGWKISELNNDYPLNTITGLKSMIYERSRNGETEYVYATAGTEIDDIRDLAADIKQVVGNSWQYLNSVCNAIILSNRLKDSELTFVGHSLGGGEAALNSLVTSSDKLKGREAITFNAAGVSVATKLRIGGLPLLLKPETKIEAYIMTADPLNALQTTLSPLLPVANGKRNYINSRTTKISLKEHKIENFIKIVMKTLPLIFIAALFLALACCEDKYEEPDDTTSYYCFKDTPAWELALAVYNGDTAKIGKIIRHNPSLINYQEPCNENTLLMLTAHYQYLNTFPFEIVANTSNSNPFVNQKQLRSFLYLINHGADVNIKKNDTGSTALSLACISRADTTFISQLIRHGADVNCVIYKSWEYPAHYTPLLRAIKNDRFDIVKLLVDNGADVNFTGDHGITPLFEAMRISGRKDGYAIAIYLLEHGADYTKPVAWRSMCLGYDNCERDTTRIYITEVLRHQNVPLISIRYLQKRKIISFLKDRGINYADTAIPQKVVDRVKKIYPLTWKLYLSLY